MVDISVIIPSRTCENRLVEAVRSIYDDKLNMEILVGIDGYDQAMRKKLESLEISCLEIYENEKKIGTTKILNKLLGHAKGIYIARMDADDIALPHRLEKQIAYMDTNLEVNMTCSNAVLADGSLIITSDSKLLNYKDFFSKNPVIHPTVVLRKSEIIAGKNFYNNNWVRAQDFELWTRISRKHKIYFDSEPLLQYTKSFTLIAFSKQYFYFQIANIKNLIWHLFKNSLCPRYLLVLHLLKVMLVPFDYLKIVVWNKLHAK